MNETISYYAEDTSRRGYRERGGCYYITEDKNRCAVGRCMTAKFIREHGTILCAVEDIPHRLDVELDETLKREYRGLPMKFWTALQGIHDSSTNWNYEGLTERGHVNVERVKASLEL